MPVRKRMLAGGARRRGNIGSVVDTSIRVLLVLEVDPAHLLLLVGEDARQGLLIAPDVGAGGLAAAVRALPAEDVAIGDTENDADVARDSHLRGEGVEQPVGQRAVVEG